ncbi:hypothetical protein EVAR_80060_1 [Eumeta japonica]|uniref:Uncharacterized protein n=1 Tax=Eumeta variegata TaxID=151549 RepID=A0A4C1WPB5_EUMVA|nr:hypothetical protein EVAR_80060_1 [Eumeta japonica]
METFVSLLRAPTSKSHFLLLSNNLHEVLRSAVWASIRISSERFLSGGTGSEKPRAAAGSARRTRGQTAGRLGVTSLAGKLIGSNSGHGSNIGGAHYGRAENEPPTRTSEFSLFMRAVSDRVYSRNVESERGVAILET